MLDRMNFTGQIGLRPGISGHPAEPVCPRSIPKPASLNKPMPNTALLRRTHFVPAPATFQPDAPPEPDRITRLETALEGALQHIRQLQSEVDAANFARGRSPPLPLE